MTCNIRLSVQGVKKLTGYNMVCGGGIADSILFNIIFSQGQRAPKSGMKKWVLSRYVFFGYKSVFAKPCKARFS